MPLALSVDFRDPAPLLLQAIERCNGSHDVWIFGYGSLIWRPDFDYVEKHAARVHGWHRALRMWSRLNRGTPELPGLVFGMLSGGSCRGLVFRVAKEHACDVLTTLWQREMVAGIYDPKWLPCQTATHGTVTALAFTLSRKSASHAAALTDRDYCRIFANAAGRYGTTHDYALRTFEELRRLGIHDRALDRLLKLQPDGSPHGAAQQLQTAPTQLEAGPT